MYWEQGDIEAARSTWYQSLDVSLSAGDLRYVLENLIGMCELDVDVGQYSAALSWRERLVPYYRETRSSHALLWSRLRKLEAEAQFALGRLDEALNGYCDALPELAKHGGWGRYKLEFELSSLAGRVDKLPRRLRMEWLDRLDAEWKQRYDELSPKRAEMLKGALNAMKG